MTRVLLDTSAYSAFFRGNDLVKAALQRAEAIRLCPIVLGEYGFIVLTTDSHSQKITRLSPEFYEAR